MRRRRRALAGAKRSQTSRAESGAAESSAAPSGEAGERLPEEPPETPAPEAHFDEGVQLLQAAVRQVRGHDADVELEPAAPARARNGRRNGGRNGNGSGNGAGNGRAAVPVVEQPEATEAEVEPEELDAEPEDAEARRRRWEEQRRRTEERRRRARARRRGGHRAAPVATPAPAETAD